MASKNGADGWEDVDESPYTVEWRLDLPEMEAAEPRQIRRPADPTLAIDEPKEITKPRRPTAGPVGGFDWPHWILNLIYLLVSLGVLLPLLRECG